MSTMTLKAKEVQVGDVVVLPVKSPMTVAEIATNPTHKWIGFKGPNHQVNSFEWFGWVKPDDEVTIQLPDSSH